MKEKLKKALRHLCDVFWGKDDYVLVSSEWVKSAYQLAYYVNYNGEEDEDYLRYLEEGLDRKDHIAYHAHVVGEWDDLVWEKHQAKIEQDT